MSDQRGVSVSLVEPVTLIDPSVLHYETGPLTNRQFMHHGQPWLVTYLAQHDGIGWLVTQSNCRPLVLMPGDYAHIRGRIEEDQGDMVLVSFEVKGSKVTRPMPRSAVVFLEEDRATERE